MKPSEQHPDELLHRARVGLPLSPQEWLIRREHLLLCNVCRFLEEARVDLLDEPARPARGKNITDLVAATMKSFEVSGSGRAVASSRQPFARGGHAHRRAPALAAALVCMVAGVALAAHWIAGPRRAGAPAPDPAPRSLATRRPRANVRAMRSPPLPGDSSEGPVALFARATAARRDGRVDEARGAYDRLWRDFPSTLEAQTGRVAYGRWLLDRSEAQPAALAFGDYLRSAPQGTLAAEASVGLAEALELLGDWPRARRVWQDVLANPTAGTFASHAKARVRSLDALVRRSGAPSTRVP